MSGRGIPLPGNDIDTDRIIPARFMKCVTFDQLGQYLFYDARYNADQSPKVRPLNQPQYKGGSILIVNRNFGCGSSREHAPQSILRYGIKALVGESFAEIFAGNCTALGIPAVRAESKDIESLMRAVEEKPELELSLDLVNQKLVWQWGSIAVSLSEQFRAALTQGLWDVTTELLSGEEETKKVSRKLPYMNQFNPVL